MLSSRSLSQPRLDRRFRKQVSALSPVAVGNKGSEPRPKSLNLDKRVTLPLAVGATLLTITPSY